MGVERGLLEDVLAHPKEDGPRLVYADWCEENGDLDRAEFVRVQVELAKLPQGDGRCRSLKARERELLARHKAPWCERLPEWARRDCLFRRGFVAAVRATAADFLRDAGQLLREAPLEALRLRKEGWEDQADSLAAYMGFDSIDPFREGLGDVRARGLAASPHLANLSHLDLRGNGIGDAGARELAASPHLANLSHLDLRNNQVGAEGRAALRQRFGTAVSL